MEKEPEGRSGLDRRDFLKMTGVSAAVLGGASVLGTDFAQAATRHAAQLRGKKVIMVIHDKNAFFSPVEKGFREFGAFMGWKVNYVGPAGQDIQKTVELQAAAIDAKPDGLIFTRIDDRAFDANIKRATSLGIPIILTNVASKGYKALGVGFVGQDFIPAGQICGTQIAAYAGKKSGKKSGKIFIGNGAPGNSALEDRATGIKQGVEAYNAKNGTSFTTEVLVGSFDEAKAIGIFEAALAANPDTVGYAATEFTHQYMGGIIKRKGLKIGNGGFDLVQPVLQGIKAGNIDFTLDQNPWAQGWVASALIGMSISPGFQAFTYDTGAAIVNSSNIVKILKREAVFA
jgi:ABC-type sugar transport system substrate-binding protein